MTFISDIKYYIYFVLKSIENFFLKIFKWIKNRPWFITTILCFLAVFLSYYLPAQESKKRRDQTCALLEATHKRNVDNLNSTYDYISELKEREVHDTLTIFVLRNLPQAETSTRIDDAPQFCDEPGIGLPEPDPVINERPERVSKLLMKLGISDGTIDKKK